MNALVDSITSSGPPTTVVLGAVVIQGDRSTLEPGLATGAALALHLDFATSTAGSNLRIVVNGHDPELPQLVERWRRERGPTSSALRAAMHPAYLRIIGKGFAAVPFLLHELQRSPDHWFLALAAITGEDPVPEEAYGDMQAMADAWVQWGKRAQLI